AALRWDESLSVQALGDLRRRMPFLAQDHDPVQELIEVAELLVELDRPDDFMLTGEATVPMNRDVHIFAVFLHVNDHLFPQVTDDLLAMLMGRPRSVPECRQIAGEFGDPSPLLRREPRGLFAEEAVVIVPDLSLIAECLLPVLLQGSSDQAILRVNGPVAPLGILGLVPRAFQSLSPMLVEAGAVTLDVFHRPAAQLQGGGLEGAQDLLRHQVVDRRRLEAEAHLLGPLV